jgi:hypothetical protein
MRTRATGRARNFLIIGGTVVLAWLQSLSGSVGFAHFNGVKVIYPDGWEITESVAGPSALNIILAVLHLLGAVLLIVGTVQLYRDKPARARVSYATAAICGLFPGYLLSLACVLFGAVVTRIRPPWRMGNLYPPCALTE